MPSTIDVRCIVMETGHIQLEFGVEMCVRVCGVCVCVCVWGGGAHPFMMGTCARLKMDWDVPLEQNDSSRVAPAVRVWLEGSESTQTCKIL